MSVIPRAPIQTEHLVLEPVSHVHDHDLLDASLASRPEAARALLSWARDAVGAQRIVFNAGMENRRSLAVAARLGFTRDGELQGGMAGGSVALFPAYGHHLDL